MGPVQDILDRLASAVVVADATDLPAIADLHTQFQQLAKAAEPAALSGAARTQVGKAEKLLEQIILREVTDADAALRSIADVVASVQQAIDHAATGSAPSETPEAQITPLAPVVETVPVAPPAPEISAEKTEAHAIGAERPITADDVTLVHEFIGEARGHLDAAEAAILTVEETPDDLEAVNAIFRSFHTIKGVAGFLNLQQIGALAHTAENMLDLARKGKLSLTGTAVDLVLESVDCMKSLIADLEQAVAQGQPIPVDARLPGLLANFQAYLRDGQANPAAAEKAPPPATTASPEPTDQTGPAKSDAGAADSAARSGASVAGGTADAMVKVATDRLDKLINMVGELVIAQSMVAQDSATLLSGNQRLARNMGHLGKITRELQDLSMSMRMVPIQGVFQKMARLVRDLARKALKEIDFVVVGGETELDRNVVEAISDPLVHMVRNAADHGIETPEDRVRAGKPPAGRITLKACHQAGSIVIEISDDGKGLNKAKVLKKAMEAGIVKEGDELSEQEIFRLIFHPGLSTAEKVTDVSGRGVGMDVVRKNVEALRGRIDINSVEGQGSTFTIRLPLTLAVIDGQVVRVGQEKYILPITSIEQSIRPKPEQISTVQERGEMCMVRGDLLPLFRLYGLFGVQPASTDPTQALVVIVQADRGRCCLMVDELLGQQQVVIKTLGESIGSVRGVSGGAILGDGNVSLILDVTGIMDMARTS